jgi:hypothetical protein
MFYSYFSNCDLLDNVSTADVLEFSVYHAVSLKICLICMGHEIKNDNVCCHYGDCEEFRLLGCKNTVHTSQETHYVSATELSRLMLCKI